MTQCISTDLVANNQTVSKELLVRSNFNDLKSSTLYLKSFCFAKHLDIQLPLESVLNFYSKLVHPSLKYFNSIMEFNDHHNDKFALKYCIHYLLENDDDYDELEVLFQFLHQYRFGPTLKQQMVFLALLERVQQLVRQQYDPQHHS